MKWISVGEQLPPDNNTFDGQKEYLVSVTCDSWDKPQTMVMNWETKMVRNKFTRRWKWRDSIVMDAWVVTHWMEFPDPAEK